MSMALGSLVGTKWGVIGFSCFGIISFIFPMIAFALLHCPSYLAAAKYDGQ
jgi:hypothetical protein